MNPLIGESLKPNLPSNDLKYSLSGPFRLMAVLTLWVGPGSSPKGDKMALKVYNTSSRTVEEFKSLVDGVIRRNVLNKKARQLGGGRFATGHNMDEEAQTLDLRFRFFLIPALPSL